MPSNSNVGPISRPPRVVVASDFATGMHIWNGMIYEIASLTAAFHGTAVINAIMRTSKQRVADRLRKRRRPDADILQEAAGEPFDLFVYVCNFPRSLAALRSLAKARRRAKTSVAFIIETWSSQAAANKDLYKHLDDFDHVFLFNETSVPAVQAMTSARCSYLPAAVDTLSACAYPRAPERMIDAFAMGRCEDAIHEDLKRQAERSELFYFFENYPDIRVRAFPEARARTYGLINRSKLFLCFNHESGAKALEAKGEAAIPNRIFEGIGAGGVLIGTAPRTKSFGPLFDWEDAFIEAPLDPAGFRAVAEDLLNSDLRLRKAGLRNMSNSLRRLDWVYRWETALETLGMPITPAMIARKEKLAATADMVERDLARLSPAVMSVTG